MVILVREWGITLLRFWVIRYGVIAGQPGRQAQDGAADRRRSPGTCGRCRPSSEPVGPWLMGAALVVTVVTGARLRAPGACRLRARSAACRREPVTAAAVAATPLHGPGRDARRRRVADRRAARRHDRRGPRGERGVPRRAGGLRDRSQGHAWPAYRSRCWPPAGRSIPDVALALAEGARRALRRRLGPRHHRRRRSGAAGRQAGRPGVRGRRRAGGPARAASCGWTAGGRRSGPVPCPAPWNRWSTAAAFACGEQSGS